MQVPYNRIWNRILVAMTAHKDQHDSPIVNVLNEKTSRWISEVLYVMNVATIQ